jgi:hypothetical protein
MRDDAELLDATLSAPPGGQTDLLPARLAGLASLAAEVAQVLATPVLSPAERQWLYERVLATASPAIRRRAARAWIGRLGRHPEVIGAAAALAGATVTAVTLAVLRGRSHHRTAAAA